MSPFGESTRFGGKISEDPNQHHPSLVTPETNPSVQTESVSPMLKRTNQSSDSVKRTVSQNKSGTKRSKRSGTHYPVALPLAQATIDHYYATHYKEGQPEPSRWEIVEGYAQAGVRTLGQRLFQVSPASYKSERVYSPSGIEMCWAIHEDALLGVNPVNAKGFLELALMTQLYDDWEHFAEKALSRPGVAEIVACLLETKYQTV